ncbi:MAG TPA: TlpA disulfide reductase family protein [Solirubrobacteraceae bacterium]|jgi:cytochrome c biogenesis protein CcmG/thiol:disulfide interchange protein DsbE|nr:TlpA disulfide reductase family protein [Solirubrobacteraceae bacterium]
MPWPRVSLRTTLFWVLAGAMVVVLAVVGLAGKGGNNGRLAPALPSERLSGKSVTLAALKGHPVLVTFWASWCGPCEQEAPALERFSRSLNGRGALVGVNWEDLSRSNAHKFVRQYGWTFPNLRDPDGTVGRQYGITTFLPTTFVLDKAGKLRMALHGAQTEQTLNDALASVLRNSS